MFLKNIKNYIIKNMLKFAFVSQIHRLVGLEGKWVSTGPVPSLSERVQKVPECSSVSPAAPQQLWQSHSLYISVKHSFIRESKLPPFGSFGQLYNFNDF